MERYPEIHCVCAGACSATAWAPSWGSCPVFSVFGFRVSIVTSHAGRGKCKYGFAAIACLACLRIESVYIRYLHTSDPDRSKAKKEGGCREGMDTGSEEVGKPVLALTCVLSGRDRKACRAWMYTSGHALLRCTRVHRARASGGEEGRIDIVSK